MKQEGELEFGCLSEDLIVEILLRLPVKSLVRFRCVSKSWLSLISDPWFAKLHHNQSSSQFQTHRLLVLSDSQLRSKSLDSLFDHGTWPLKHQLPFPKPKYSFDVAGSSNGLLCIQVDRFESLFIWNPSTGYYKQLPGLRSLKDRSCSRLKYGFGYDSLTDDYVVLVASCHLDDPISQTQVEFFSVATDSWTKCEDPDYDLMLGQLSCGLLSNGALHWLVLCPGSDYKGCRIIAYDLAERKFGEVPLPDGNIAGDTNLDFGNLRVVQGCLTLNSKEDYSSNYQIWIMRDYGVKASWTKLITIYSYSGIGFNNIIPVSITDTDDGEVVVMNDWLDGDLYKLNQDGASICCRGTFLYYSRFKGVYVESLLSLADPYE